MPFFSRRSSTGFHGLPGPDAFGGSPGLMWPRPVWSSWPWLNELVLVLGARRDQHERA